MREPPAEGPADQVALALTTEASAPQAESLARQLLERKLAACVALQPQQALYWWEGELQHSCEVQLLIKTTPERLPALRYAVHELHSYDTPEWLSWLASSSLAYGSWIRSLPDPDAPEPGLAD